MADTDSDRHAEYGREAGRLRGIILGFWADPENPPQEAARIWSETMESMSKDLSGKPVPIPDIREASIMIWHPTGPGTWHEHFEQGHEHEGGDRPHLHGGDDELRAALADELERQIRPLLDVRKYDEPPGYNCCGCSTYHYILDHAIAIVRGKEYVHGGGS